MYVMSTHHEENNKKHFFLNGESLAFQTFPHLKRSGEVFIKCQQKKCVKVFDLVPT